MGIKVDSTESILFLVKFTFSIMQRYIIKGGTFMKITAKIFGTVCGIGTLLIGALFAWIGVAACLVAHDDDEVTKKIADRMRHPLR